MIKSNGGDGYVKDCVFENFIGHGNAYSLNIDQYWASISTIAGAGVALSGLTFTNWTGTEANGNQRGPVQVKCADTAPCTDVTISDLEMWTESGSIQKYICRSGYGSGFCLHSGSGTTSYTTTSTVSAAPSGYSAPKMASDLAAGLGLTVSIAIPTTIPTSFFPGATPLSKLLNGSGAGASSKTAIATTTTTASGGTSSCAPMYGQCGGSGWTGATCCSSGTCTISNTYYSQCL